MITTRAPDGANNMNSFRMAMEQERTKLFEELAAMKTTNEGFIDYKEFKMFIKEAETDSFGNSR